MHLKPNTVSGPDDGPHVDGLAHGRRDICEPFLEQLTELYATMDRAYETVAGQYGFDCRGCADNCCQTHFYHHTHLEVAFILKGYDALDPAQRAESGRHARALVGPDSPRPGQAAAPRAWCPLNVDGLCRLYAFRPMICRLHGLPHQLQKPGRPLHRSPGCDQFAQQCGNQPYRVFDRTRFYVRLAQLEKAFRETLGCPSPIKLTIAQMLVRGAVDASPGFGSQP